MSERVSATTQQGSRNEALCYEAYGRRTGALGLTEAKGTLGILKGLLWVTLGVLATERLSDGRQWREWQALTTFYLKFSNAARSAAHNIG